MSLEIYEKTKRVEELVKERMEDIESSIQLLREKYMKFHSKVVQALEDNDRTTASLYYNELREIRGALLDMLKTKYVVREVMSILEKDRENLYKFHLDVYTATLLLDKMEKVLRRRGQAYSVGLGRAIEELESLMIKIMRVTGRLTPPLPWDFYDTVENTVMEAERWARGEAEKLLPPLPR